MKFFLLAFLVGFVCCSLFAKSANGSYDPSGNVKEKLGLARNATSPPAILKHTRLHSGKPILSGKTENLQPNWVDDPRSLSIIAPLPLPKPLSLAWRKPLGPDPIRFTLHASKTYLKVGEEVDLLITAELLPITPSQLFFFESQRSFSVKLLIPEGFEQTGGDYYEYIGAELRQDGITSIAYHLRGRFVQPAANAKFTLLRGPKDASVTSLFEKKQELRLETVREEPVSLVGARLVAATDTGCQLLTKPIRVLTGPTVKGATSLTVLIQNASPTYGYSADSITFSSNNVLRVTKTSGFLFVRESSQPACYRKLAYTIATTGGQQAGTNAIGVQPGGSEPSCNGPSGYIGVNPGSGVICNQYATAAPGGSQARTSASAITLTVTGCTNNIAWHGNGVEGSGGTSVTIYQPGSYYVTCGTSFCPNSTNYSNVATFTGCADPCAGQNRDPQWNDTGQWRCNGADVQILVRDDNPCSYSYNRTEWRTFSANNCVCKQTPNWQNSEIQCNNGNRQWKQHDYNDCTNQGDRWGDVVEYNTCACRSNQPDWRNTEIQCNNGNRQWKQHDFNECSNQGDRWGDVVEYNTCACRSTAPDWRNAVIECNNGNRQWKQHDYNECSNQGDRWGNIVEYNTCACRSTAPDWRNTVIECNNGNRQWKQHDFNECSNQGDRWGDIVEYNTCTCRSTAPDWRNTEIQCNNGNRQWRQHDYNECSGLGDRWGDVVEYNTCACRSTVPDWRNTEIQCNNGNRQWKQHDFNECSNLGDRWGDIVENNSCACRSTNVVWAWTNDYRCSPTTVGTRQRRQINTNSCNSATEQWVDVEVNTCDCRPKPDAGPYTRILEKPFENVDSQTLCEGGNIAFGLRSLLLAASFGLYPGMVRSGWESR
ncbi:hypothetical protein GCM10028805_58250 [Spirosoma harenae]